MLFAFKVGTALFSPLGLSLLLSVISFAVWRCRVAKLLLASAFAVLWLSSAPVVANWLYAGLESEYPAVPIEQLPAADIAIVLGGAIGQPVLPRVVPDLDDAVDRIFEAVRLFRAGKVRSILVSGGNLPWQSQDAPEAELAKGLLVEFGVPSLDILTEDESRNTHENAVNCARLLQGQNAKTVLLVTSAAHMPRALATFRAAGINATPATTDVRSVYPLWASALDFLPDAGALARTSDALKERLGMVVYRFLGWA